MVWASLFCSRTSRFASITFLIFKGTKLSGTVLLHNNSAWNSLLKLICHNNWTKQKITCQCIHLSCLLHRASAESTVKQQEYKCFKLLNEISCIPQAKITLFKKDVNVFCTRGDWSCIIKHLVISKKTSTQLNPNTPWHHSDSHLFSHSTLFVASLAKKQGLQLMHLLIKAEKKANFRCHTTCVLIRHKAMICDQPPLTNLLLLSPTPCSW